MTSPADEGVLDRLDAPAKAALRWARAMAVARAGAAQAVVDDVDLLAGILLADPRGSPAREFLDHYAIPVGAVLRRDHSRPPSAEELLAALDHLGTDQVTPTVMLQYLGVTKPTGRLISLRDLFGALLRTLPTGPIHRELARLGVDGDELIQSYDDYLAGRATYGEFLRERHPYQAPPVELPGYAADQPRAREPDALPDLVGINAEVDAFAYLIASTRLAPPLAVGLFGDWGSGKSYFLRSLQRRIDLVARDAAASPPGTARLCHPHIVQIEFNAWQYVGGDLWASLLEHLFRNLRRSGDDSDNLLAERQHYWIRKVQGATTERVEAERKREELSAQRDAARQQVDELRQDQERALATLERQQRDQPAGWWPSEELRRRISDAAATAGVDVVGEQAEELAGELGQAREALQGLGSVLAPLRARGWRHVAKVGLLIALPIVVTLVITALDPASLTAVTTTVASWLVAAVGYVKLATKVVSDTTTRIREAEAELAAGEDAQRAELDGKVAEAEERLAEAQSELDAAVTTERELAEAADEVAAELAATTPRRVLNEFIADRLASEDYRRHLGVPAIVRRDLERLSQLVAEQRADPDTDPVPDQYAIDRIVLYVDDLDRCPTELVIKVLEAVHLLLAFPLFVVVVAVDSRWLTRSLAEHYSQLRGQDATPENYLEKIFQVPFWVLPVEPRTRQRILRGLLLPNLASSPAASGAETRVVTGDLPPAEVPEFRELVESFAVTDRPDQVRRTATDLTVTADELLTIESVADLIGATPRAAKRFVNTYLLTKAMGVNKGLTLPPDGQLAVLLAISTGLPVVADRLFPQLTPGRTLADLVRSSDEPRLVRWLEEHPEHKEHDLAGAEDWLGLITRFRFTTGKGSAEDG